MAARVNTKFVAIIIAVPIAMAMLLAGVWYFGIRTDPRVYIERGDALAAQGDLEHAAEQYGMAVARRSDDVELIGKYADTLGQIPMTQTRPATETLQRLIKLRATAAELRGSDDAILQAYFSLLYTLGQDLRKFEAWDLILKQADVTLGRNPNSQLARKYRGIAFVQRMRMVDVEPTLRQQTLEDLQAAHETWPNDHEVNLSLAMWYALQSRENAKPGGDTAVVEDYREKTVAILQASVAASPDDVQRQVDLLGMYVTLGRIDDAATLADKLAAELQDDPSPTDAVLGYVGARLLLGAAITGRGDQADSDQRRQVIGLLRRTHTQQPNDLAITAALATQLANQRPPTGAITLFEQVHDTSLAAPVLDYLKLDEVKMRPDAQYVGVLLNLVELERDASKHDATLAKAEALLDDIVLRAADTAEVMFLRGRLALMKGDAQVALDLLDRSIAASSQPDARALVLSAKARIELKQWGAAIEQLAKVRELRPNYTPAQYELANLYLKRGNTSDAMREIAALQADHADQPQVRMLHARALGQSGDVDQAIRVMEAMGDDAHPEAAVLLAQFHLMNQDRDTARRVLEAHYANMPKDVRALELLLGLSASKSQSLGYLAQAREAGLARTADLFESRLESRQSMADTLERMIDEGMDDPFARHMARAELLRTTGRLEAAKQQLAEAAKLRPDDPKVIDLQFEFALHDKQWQRAGELASRAGEQNLDGAQGRFFVGRLLQARGESDQAAVILQSALDRRPIYADGWRLLGQVQMAMGDVTNARVSLRRALSQQPDNLAALQAMARVLDMQGQRQEALTTLRDAYRTAPADVSLRTQYLAYEQQYGDAEKALQMRRSLATSAPSDINNRQMLALMLAERGEAETAYAMADALVAEYPQVRQNLAAAALVRRAAGEPDDGRTLLLERVQRLGDQANVEDWIMLGRYLLTIEEVDEALAAFRRGQRFEDADTRRATRHIAAYFFGARQFGKARPYYADLWQSDPDDQTIALQYVETLFRVGDLDTSARVLADAEQRFEPSVNALLLAAQLAQQRGETAAVGAALDQAVQLAPLRGAVYYERARMQIDNDAPMQGVIDDLQRAIKLDPTLLEAYRLLAAQYAQMGDRELAVRQLTTLIDLNPDEVAGRITLAELYTQSNDLVALRALLDDAARRMPDHAVWQRLLARLAQVQGRMSDAVGHLRRVWELEPTDASLASLVRSMVANDQLNAALQLMRDMPHIVQASVTVQSLQAQALAMAGETDKSQVVFTNAMRNSDTVDQLMIIARHMKESLGEQAARAAIEQIGSGDGEVRFTLARLRLDLDAQRYEAVVAQVPALRGRLRDDDSKASLARMEAYAMMMLDRVDDAVKAYRAVLAADTSDISSMNNLAYLLNERLNDPKAALPLAAEAAKRVPDSPNVLDTYGWVLFKLGRIDESYRVLTQAVERGASASNVLHLAEAQLARGDTRQGRESLSRAATLAAAGDDAALRDKINARMAVLGMEAR